MLIVTAADYANLSLLESPKLLRLLARARVLPFDSVPADLVTMYSRVLCVDTLTGERRVLIPVYPGEEDGKAGKVSVLGAGMALLGASRGQEVECELAAGEGRRMRIEALLYQPEHDLRANLILRR